MAWNIVEALQTARNSVFLGAEALNGCKSEIFQIPPERPRNAEAKYAKRNGWEIDRENLANDWRRVENGLSHAINQRGTEK